jgi:hypothetical protein
LPAGITTPKTAVASRVIDTGKTFN